MKKALDPTLLVLPAVKLLVHFSTANGYGYFRDELYYLACADHPGFGYVDHPALSILVLKGWAAAFGTSMFSIRGVPAVAGALTVLFVGLLARRMGGGRPAQQLAMLAALCAPMQLGLANYYSMNSLDLLVWAVAAYVFAGILLEENPGVRRWVVLGVVLGLGLENKLSVLWLGGGIAAGLILTGRRRLLLTPGPWLGAAVAFVFALPYAFWNLASGWPTLEFMRNATGAKMAGHTCVEFASEQLRSMGFPIWLAGAAWLLLARRARRFRPLGVAFAVVWLFLAFSGTSRASYPAASYSWVFAAAGVAVFTIKSVPWRRAAAGLAGAAVVLQGAVLAPFALPILPVERFIRYQAALGMAPGTEENKEIGALPQHWADRQGWPEVVDAFESAWLALPTEERAQAALFASDYGVAGAIDLLGTARGLPKAISGHNSYWLWGPRNATGEVVIVHSNNEDRLREAFRSVELHGRVSCGLCMPYENGVGIWICRGADVPLDELWPSIKNFD